MDKAVKRLIKAEGLKNNYLPRLSLLALIIISSFTSFGQYDSSRNLQPVNGQGTIVKNQQVLGGFIIPRDTPTLAVRDSGGIAYKGGKFWVYNGYIWLETASGTVLVHSSDYDSLTINGSNICKWVGGTSICTDQSRFIAFQTLNYDSTKYLHYNLDGDLLDSVVIPHTDIFTYGGLIQRDSAGGKILAAGRLDSMWLSSDSVWEYHLYMSGAIDSTQRIVGDGSGSSGSAVSSGTFTSAVTSTLNISSTDAAPVIKWTKIDGNVHLSITAGFTPTATGATMIRFTLPSTTSLGNGSLVGSGSIAENGGVSIVPAYVFVSSSSAATIRFINTAVASGSYFITIDYHE